MALGWYCLSLSLSLSFAKLSAKIYQVFVNKSGSILSQCVFGRSHLGDGKKCLEKLFSYVCVLPNIGKY